MPTRRPTKPARPASGPKAGSQRTAKAAAKSPGKGPRGRGAGGGASAAATSARSTVSGPSHSDSTSQAAANDALTAKMEGTQALAAAMPSNANKAGEYGKAARVPQPGATVEPDDPAITGSTLTETIASTKTGDGEPPAGINPTSGPLDRVRVDSGGQALTTNQGVPIATNQDSLKVGLRGPALLEDFILREKLTHFDHERIPERVVHARGSGAHGFFECYESLAEITRASIFAEAGKRTPVFVRFSTVIGERGSTDTPRDVRGFAVKFYTDEGNWDLVGNNMPVFFIQDAMKFPDLIHAAKPRAALPDAAGGHRARHVLGLRLADARIGAHDHVGDVGPRDTAQLPHDAGLRRAHLPFRQRRGRVALREVPLEPGRGYPLAGLGRGGEDRGRRSRLPPPRPVGGDRGGRVPRVGARRAGLHRGAGRALQLRRARRDEARSGGARAGAADRPHGAQPQSGQFLRRDRAGRLLHGAHRAGPRLQQRSAACGPHPLVRRHADHAPRRTELPRDPDQRTGRAGPQQPARRHASAGDQSRARGVRAELARGRLPVPGGRSRLHFLPAAVERGQGARPAGEVRRPLHAGEAVLPQPDARGAGAHHRGAPLRADDGAGTCRAPARARHARQHRRRPRGRRGGGTRHGRAGAAAARTGEAGARRRSMRRRRCRCSRGRATAASARDASASSSPTAATPMRPRRCTRGSPSSARCRATSARRSVPSRATMARPSRSRSRSRRCRRCCSTPSRYPVATMPRRRWARSATSPNASSTPTATASRSWRSAPRARSSRTRVCRRACRRATRIPDFCCTRTTRPRPRLAEFVTAIAKHRHFMREMDPPPV